MKVVIAGGSGQLGQVLTHALARRGNEVVVLSRRPFSRAQTQQSGPNGDTRAVEWDGKSLGAWADELDAADAVINLAGRSVNCRYTEANLRQMLESRVDSTRAVGLAVERARRPPRVWLQMSTATIYAHQFDAPNDEATGRIGGSEPDAPAYWRRSIEIASAWEATLAAANTPATRKIAMRTAMVMSSERGGVFDVLVGLTRWGLGGPLAGGGQFVSWIHACDFVRAVLFLMERDDLDGPVNLAAPVPLVQRAFMRVLRRAWGAPIGLPASAWMAKLGAVFLRTDTELVLKSRRVVPRRLMEAGFSFQFPDWSSAAPDLVGRWRSMQT